MASGKGVIVNLKKESNTLVSIWCSGRLIGWVSGKDSNDTTKMAKAIMEWYGLEYDHDRFGPLMELRDGEKHLKELLDRGYAL